MSIVLPVRTIQYCLTFIVITIHCRLTHANTRETLHSVKEIIIKLLCELGETFWYCGKNALTFTFLSPGHWTCSLVCHLNSTESIQTCSHFDALYLSYTLPSLSYHVLIFTGVKWSIWGLGALSKNSTSKQCPNIESDRETWYFLKICTKRYLKPHDRQRHWQSSALDPLRPSLPTKIFKRKLFWKVVLCNYRYLHLRPRFRRN